MTHSDALPAVPQPRWAALDLARGGAVVAMVVYHTAWDLSFLRLVETNVIASPGWSLFARSIAATFLVLAGIGLVLAHGRGVRWRAFLRRLAIIAGAALAITVVTKVVFPDTFIFFGILHCIVASSLVALPFLRAPPILTVFAAAFSLAAPMLLASPAFDVPALLWTGLGTSPPATNDWAPLFPWFGWVLVGVAAGRWGLSRGAIETPRVHPSGPIARALIWSGRLSLPIYLLHQPALLGVLFLAAQMAGPDEKVERTSFLDACEASCRATGRETKACVGACLCVADGLRRERLWTDAVANRLGENERERVLALSRGCLGGRARGLDAMP